MASSATPVKASLTVASGPNSLDADQQPYRAQESEIERPENRLKTENGNGFEDVPGFKNRLGNDFECRHLVLDGRRAISLHHAVGNRLETNGLGLIPVRGVESELDPVGRHAVVLEDLGRAVGFEEYEAFRRQRG